MIKIGIREGEITLSTTMVAMTCCNCGMPFAVTADFNRRRLEDNAWFYCPNGHPQRYAQSEIDRLKRALASAEGNSAYYRELADSRERSRRALRGVATRLKNRAKQGQCPYCDASFPALAEHIAEVHPNEDPEIHEGDESEATP